MINIFRRFHPINAVWLAILLFVLRIGYVFHAPDNMEFTFVEPFARALVPLDYEHFFSTPVNILLAAVLVFAQALLVNYLANKHNLLNKSTFLPALMYVMASGLFTPFLVLSPPLICNFLVIWMLFKLFDFYKNEDGKSNAYDVGLIIFRPFDWREWVSGVIGFATVFFFLAVFYYMNNSFSQFYNIWAPLGASFPKSINIDYYNYLVLIPVIVILALCFVKLRQNFFKSYVQIRKSFQLLFWVFIIAGLSFYVKEQFNLNHFLLCAVPAAIFFAYYFLYANVKWFYESLFFLLLACIIYFQFNTF